MKRLYQLVPLIALVGSSVVAETARPIPTLNEPPHVADLPRTRAHGPRLDFANERRGVLPDPESWPDETPREYDAANSLHYLVRDELALNFEEHRGEPGYFTGPDGGSVYQWAANHYAWKLTNGLQFTTMPDGTWMLEGHGHTIVKYGRADLRDWHFWNFPDGGQIRRSPHPRSGDAEYFFSRMTEDRSDAFELVDATALLPGTANRDGILFFYSPGWQPHVSGFERFDRLDEFFGFMEHHFGFIRPTRIPVRMFPDVTSFRKHANNPLAGPGGYGGMFGVAMCCGELEPTRPSDPVLAEAARRAESFSVLIHEITHVMQQHRCHYARGTRDLPEPVHPGDWYVEGIADFAVMQFDSRARASMYQQLFQRIDRNRVPAADDLGYANLNAYIFGRMIISYLADKHGFEAVKNYYDATCQGHSVESAMNAATESSLEQVFGDALNYHENRRTQIEERYIEWDVANLYELSFANASELRDHPPNPAEHLMDVTSVPDIREAFLVRGIERFAGDRDWTLRSNEGHRIFVWKNERLYMVEENRYKAYVRPEEVSLHFDGHVIINWSNGQRRYVMPDGSYFHMWDEGRPYGYFDKDDRPLAGAG